MIDVGTDNVALRGDPLYCGLNMARLSGKSYYDIVDEVGSPAQGDQLVLRHWHVFR